MKRSKGYRLGVFVAAMVMGLMVMRAEAITNEDKPLRGEYTFPLEKVWIQTSAGDNVFGLLVGISVTDSGNVICRDLKNKQFYIFDRNGKYVKTFAQQGEAPGKVQAPGNASLFTYQNTILIADAARIHYYDHQGNYSRSAVNSNAIRPVTIVINEDEFISAPTKLQNAQKGNAQVKHVNLKTGSERVITDFMLFNSGVFQRDTSRGRIQASATIPTITPVMVISKHENRLYFGMNSKYEIFISDMAGKSLGSFLLNRKAREVTLRERETVMERLVQGFAPPEVGRQVAKTLPDRETYFVNIDFFNDQIYVGRSHFPAYHQQQIDIFSANGKYLYRAFVRLEEGTTILAGPLFSGDFIYLAWEDEEGESYLGKFTSTIPR